MSSYRVLYYPDFVPDALWLRRILLLTDEVVRIVPDDVRPEDSDDLLRIQDAIPGCLTNVVPQHNDVSLDHGERDRLARAFEIVRQERASSSSEVVIEIGPEGRTAIPDHVFVHDAKLSEFVLDQLRHNELLIEGMGELAGERFVVVQRDASDLILAGLASRIAGRLGLDALTDKPLPFARNALRGMPAQPFAKDGEGALLSALAGVLVPAEVTDISTDEFRELRASYADIRESFQQLTAELAQANRLAKIDDPVEFGERIRSVAADFQRKFSEYQNSRYARRFKSWGPFYVGALLALPTAYFDPLPATLLTAGGLAMDVVARNLEIGTEKHGEVFNMLAGLRQDVLEQSKFSMLI